MSDDQGAGRWPEGDAVHDFARNRGEKWSQEWRELAAKCSEFRIQQDRRISALTAEVARLEGELREANSIIHESAQTGQETAAALRGCREMREQAEAELRAVKGQYTPEEWAEKVDYTRGMARKLKQAEAERDKWKTLAESGCVKDDGSGHAVDMCPVMAERDAARAEVERKNKALKWYGDKTNYTKIARNENWKYGATKIQKDEGKKVRAARAALTPEGKACPLSGVSSEDMPGEFSKIVDKDFDALLEQPQAGGGEEG